jgi:hypothetical protein
VSDRRLAATLACVLLMVVGLGVVWLLSGSTQAPDSLAAQHSASDTRATDVEHLVENGDIDERTTVGELRTADATPADVLDANEQAPAQLASVVGVLVDENERGIEGVELELTSRALPYGETAGEATTDALGRFEFAGLENGNYSVQPKLYSTKRGLWSEFVPDAGASTRQMARLHITAPEVHTLTVRVWRPATLVIRILDAGGELDPNAMLAISDASRSSGHLHSLGTKDAITLRDLRPDEYTVRLELDGPDPIARTVQLRSGETQHLELRTDETDGALITGRLVDSDLDPVGGQTLRLLHEDLSPCGGVGHVVSDRDGAFALGRLTPGRYVLDLTRSATRAIPELVQGNVVLDVGTGDVAMGDLLVSLGDGWAIAGTLAIDPDWAQRTVREEQALTATFELVEPELRRGADADIYAFVLTTHALFSAGTVTKPGNTTFALGDARLPQTVDGPTWQTQLRVAVAGIGATEPRLWETTLDVTLERGKSTAVDVVCR